MNPFISAITVASLASLTALIINSSATAQNTFEFVLGLSLIIITVISLTLNKLYPVTLKDIYMIYFGHPGSILNLAHKCMLSKKDYWSIRDNIFWGQRTCILTSEKSVNDVLNNGALFERVKAPGDSITSPHSILGAGGVSNTWKRFRTICRPYFNQGEFEEANDSLVQHIINSVEYAIENDSSDDGIDLFQLVNRFVVEAHLMTMLGIDADTIAPQGKNIPVRDYIDTDKVSTKCMADIIDESLNVKLAEPKFTSPQFAPMMTFLTDRLLLSKDQLGGIDSILAAAVDRGELSNMERLHNCIMYMIALAPSPASFWTLVHVYTNREHLDTIRSEGDVGEFTTLSMCVKETLRMYAPVPIMVTRYVRTKNQKKGSSSAHLLRGHDKVELKDGDRVLIPTIILHNNAHLWKDPNTYDPSRFEAPTNLKTVGKKATALLLRGSGVQPRPVMKSIRSQNTSARYFPFGQGKHTCLGQPYASWLTMTICATIFNNFDVEIEDVDGLLDEECSYQRVKDHVYTFPKGVFKAKVTSLRTEEDNDVVDSKEEGKVDTRISIRNSNLKKSMMINMHDFSEFLQNTAINAEDSDDDDDDYDDITFGGSAGADEGGDRLSGMKSSTTMLSSIRRRGGGGGGAGAGAGTSTSVPTKSILKKKPAVGFASIRFADSGDGDANDMMIEEEEDIGEEEFK